jgi:hypothetical protein
MRSPFFDSSCKVAIEVGPALGHVALTNFFFLQMGQGQVAVGLTIEYAGHHIPVLALPTTAAILCDL